VPDREPPLITRLAEYSGEPSVRLKATQLGTDYSPTQARKVVAEWVEYFGSGPSPIQELRLVTRTPKRLFDALAGQTQLQLLTVKWGDYDDLSPLSGLQGLRTLALRGASKVADLGPLAGLRNVQTLDVEGFVRLDLAPIGKMQGVVDLDLGGNWMTPRIAHVNSIAFLRQMPQLRRLILHTMIVDDLDYSPILDLPNLEAVRVMEARGMRPTHEELMARTPWSG
jgi:hypothetical protein